MRATGINFRQGALYIATVESARGEVVNVDHARIKPAASLSDEQALADLRDRVRQHLAAQETDAAAVVETRKFKSWAYKQAYARVFAICAALMAASDRNVSCATVRTEAIARSVNVKANTLQDFDYARVGFPDRPQHWTAGLAEAYACATHLCVIAEASR